MKIAGTILLTFVLGLNLISQGNDTLLINYYPNSPFANEDNGQVTGIEAEIMNEYVLWMKAKKKINISFRYVKYTDFDEFYKATKNGPQNCIGLGAVTISQERMKDVTFAAPYLKSVAFCITNGNAPDVKNKTPDDIMRTLGSMNALTTENSILNKYVNELKKQYLRDLKITYKPDEARILDEISRNVLNFGYVNAIGFWFYVKNNPGKFLKMQKVLSQSREDQAFIMPKGSPQKALFDEFFTGPGGFRNSPNYRAILERYLGSYMAQNVAIN